MVIHHHLELLTRALYFASILCVRIKEIDAKCLTFSFEISCNENPRDFPLLHSNESNDDTMRKMHMSSNPLFLIPNQRGSNSMITRQSSPFNKLPMESS